MPPTQPLPTILVAEDDPNDLVLFQQALADLGVKHPIVTFGNGADVIQFLRDWCTAPDRDEANLPRLLFLDLHIPQVDGCGVVAWIRRHKELAGLRIVVVSGSGDSKDVQRAEMLGADRILVKPPPEAALAVELKRLDAPPRA